MAKARKSSKWFMTAVMGLMVLAMAGFGLEGMVGASKSTAAIVVGDTKIDVSEYNQSYQTALSGISEQFNRQVSTSEARLMGLPDQVSQQLVQYGALNETANRGNLQISDAQVATEIANIKAFQDPTGKVDPARYASYLSGNNISETVFVKKMRDQMTSDLVVRSLVNIAPDFGALKAELNSKFGEERSAVYIAFDATQTGADNAAPSDAELQKYYDANTKNYMAAPEREIDLAYLVPESDKITDAEMKTIYDNNLDRYTSVEIVEEFYTLSFPTQAEAEKVKDLAGLKAVAKERGLQEADYKFSKTPLSNLPSELVKLVKEKGNGYYSALKSDFGYSSYEILSVTPAKTLSFEEAKKEIADGIAYDALQEKLSASQSTALDLAAGGVKPSELAKEAGLNFKSITLGKDAIAGITDDKAFTDAIAKSRVDENHDIVTLANGGIAYFRVKSEKPAQALSFDAVKAKVTTDFQNAKAQADLSAFHELLMNEIKSGKTIEAVAKAHKLEIVTSPLLRQSDATSKLPLPIAFELFSKKLGEVWDVKDIDKDYIIRVEKTVNFDPKDPKNADFITQSNAGFGAQIGDEIINNYTKNLASELNATMNPKLIEQVVGVDEQ